MHTFTVAGAKAGAHRAIQRSLCIFCSWAQHIELEESYAKVLFAQCNWLQFGQYSFQHRVEALPLTRIDPVRPLIFIYAENSPRLRHLFGRLWAFELARYRCIHFVVTQLRRYRRPGQFEKLFYFTFIDFAHRIRVNLLKKNYYINIKF